MASSASANGLETTTDQLHSSIKAEHPPGSTHVNPAQANAEENFTQGQAVRFSSVLQEIEPSHSLHRIDTLTSDNSKSNEQISPEAEAELRDLSKTLQDAHLQHRRFSHFAFEPVSLPVSRVPSHESSLHQVSKDGLKSGGASPRPSPSISAMHTPPLTPAVSGSREVQQNISKVASGELAKVPANSIQMTPHTSMPQKTPPQVAVDKISVSAQSRPCSASGRSLSQHSGALDTIPKHAPDFSLGPSRESVPVSREDSPTNAPGSGSGTSTPPSAYTRPFAPIGDRDDPYARSKRPPQSRNLDSIDSRFIFSSKDNRRSSGSLAGAGVVGALPRSNSGGDLKAHAHDKAQSAFSLHSLGKKDHTGHLQEGKSHGSMSDLKRFFRIGHSGNKRSQSPTTSAKSTLNSSGTRTPPHQVAPSNVPFADDHGLQSKYGKFGKVLGSGAGGSVRLMKRSSDGVTFAVKQFRDRHSYETEREYAKKVTAEFCIGSTLHHGNVIETLDIIYEKGHWYEVMEFAPFDLFAIVMTGRMSREEVACSFLQIFAGVTYLHSMGLAHRDLKLDNVVVNEHGIMKLIDFGSATVFRYPFENDIVMATGVVGSDPYLAPEVYDNHRYDPQLADIWSLAIIFACMSLRRFPWKAPRLNDNSYKLFVSPPTLGTSPAEGALRRPSDQRPKSTTDLPAEADGTEQKAPPALEGSSRHSHSHHSHHHASGVSLPEQAAGAAATDPHSVQTSERAEGMHVKPEVIRGPWRLLRLLPRESRTIVGRMLEVDPKKRATMEEMMEDPWISNTPVCRQLDGGQVIRAVGHEHTLEPGTVETPAPSKK